MQSITTPDELSASLGEAVKKLRLQKNLDRGLLALRSGVSLSAIKNLEGGKGATVTTLMRVVKALGKESWVFALAPTTSVNPLALTSQRGVRQRASGTRKKEKDGANAS